MECLRVPASSLLARAPVTQRYRPTTRLASCTRTPPVSAVRVQSKIGSQNGSGPQLRSSVRLRVGVSGTTIRQPRLRCSASTADAAAAAPESVEKPKTGFSLSSLLQVALKTVLWFGLALFVAAWVVHPSGPLGLEEASLPLMQMPNEASGPFAGLAAWFAGTYNYAVRVIQQDAKPAMDHLLLRQLPALLHAVGDMCYNPSGAASSHAAAVAFWLVVDTVYNALLLAVITLVNIFLLAPTTLLGVLWAFPAALGNALFGSPDTALRVGGALAMAVLLYLGVNTARAKLAAAQQAPMGAGGAQQVVVAETPMEGLEALRRSMAAYDQSVRGLPPLLYQTAAAAPDAPPELASASEKLYVAESALDDVEDVFKGKGVVAYTTTVSTAAQVLKLGPSGTMPLSGPAAAAAITSIVSKGQLPGSPGAPRGAAGATAAGAPSGAKPAPPAKAAASGSSAFQSQMTLADRDAANMYLQADDSSAKSAASSSSSTSEATTQRKAAFLSSAAAGAAAAAAPKPAAPPQKLSAKTAAAAAAAGISTTSASTTTTTTTFSAEVTEALDTLKPVATYVSVTDSTSTETVAGGDGIRRVEAAAGKAGKQQGSDEGSDRDGDVAGEKSTLWPSWVRRRSRGANDAE